MVRTERRCPGGTEIGNLGLQAFDVESQGRAAGEREEDGARRRVALNEVDSQEAQHRILIVLMDVAAFDGVDALEPPRRSPAAILRIVAPRRLPVEPVDPEHEPLL